MRYQRRFQTFRPGKAQKMLRWSAVNLFGLFLVFQYQYEHPAALILLAGVLGLSLLLLLASWWKHYHYESRRLFD
jgi:hypothetical protein